MTVFHANHSNITYQDVHLDGVLGEAVFEEAVLEDAKPGRFESPTIAGTLVTQLESLHLLVLAGWGIEDKSLLARHLAWYLQDKLKARHPTPVELPALEWNPPKLTVDLGDALRKLKAPSILLMPRAQPNQLGYDLSGLHQVLIDRGHFAIITTDINSARWNLHQGDPWWHELRSEDIYDSERLTAVLRTSLAEVRSRLPRNLLPEGLDHETRIFFGKLILRDVAVMLRTPPAIRSFVHLLCEAPAEVSQKDIDRLLAQFQADEHGHRAWYLQIDRRQQLLALGLALLDGLYDDQIFAGLERLVEAIWRKRDPTLTQFDYYDFLDFDRKFEGTQPAATTRRIVSRSSELRPVILKSAWELHRRHVLSALPALTEILTKSIEYASHAQTGWKGWATRIASQRAKGTQGADNQPPADTRLSGWEPHSAERELFGSKGRADLLCGTIATSLSRIGLLSFETVEPLLLRLASDPRKELKAIVAVALAEWRLTDEDSLFKVLNDWQDDALLRERVRRLVGLEALHQTAQVRATVALAASFAVQYDKPNQMSEKLRALFVKLLHDQHQTVRDVFREEMLPLIVSVHIRELEPLLRQQALPQLDLLGGLALGLATACSLQPGTALPILDRWYKEARSKPPAGEADGPLSDRETLLAATILAYGNLNTRTSRDGLLTAKIFGRLRNVMAEEPHQFVRRTVLWAAMLQARLNFPKVSSLLQDLASEISLQERAILIPEITEVYLEERRDLEGGESYVDIEGSRYRIWTQTHRPFTEVESILYRWIRDDRRPVAQQLAFDCLASFLATELDQRERELAFAPQVVQHRLSPPQTIAVQHARVSLREPSLFEQMAIFLTARREPVRRATLRTLFPELIHWWASPNRETSRRLLERWRSLADPEIPKIAGLLEGALWFVQNRALLIVGLLFVLSVVWYLLTNQSS